MDSWTRDMQIEDLPEQYHPMVKLIGLAAFLELMQGYGGTYQYIPKMDMVLRKVRDDKIRGDFNGSNYKQLAVKYSLTEISIRRIVEGERNRQVPGQLSILDM